MPRSSPSKIGGVNVAAFLDTLAHCEIGPDMLAASDDGYNVIVGSKPGNLTLMPTYAAHPKTRIWLPKYGIYSTAAGRYQILAKFYEPYKKLLKLSDFSPESQDAIAARMLKEQGSLALLQAGRLAEAVEKCRDIWASLPGAGYGQREHGFDTVKAVYLLHGGTLA